MMQLSQHELRVIGCLIEKSITTPEQYPLSLNALTNACNQKSNRDPVLSLSELEVQNTIDDLMEKRLILIQSGVTSRVAKYQHRFCNTEFSDLQLSAQALAILCVLFLRGPQTPGELRTRTARLCQFQNVQETETALNQMEDSDNQSYVVKLPREPGRRESRYCHCFAENNDRIDNNLIHNQPEHSEMSDNQKSIVDDMASVLNKVVQLEETIDLMQLEIDELRQDIKNINR